MRSAMNTRDRTPLELIEDFLLSDSSKETGFADRLLVYILKAAVVLTMLAAIIAAFALGSWALSWVYVNAIEFVFKHWRAFVLVVAVLLLWSFVGGLKAKRNRGM
jgi:hypothetical protein